MRLSQVKELLNAEVLHGEQVLTQDIRSAFSSDYMSDVLAFSESHALLLTGLVNPQVVRTADMMDMVCIIFVRGKTPGADLIEMAEDRGIAVLATSKGMYESCGLLYSNGLRGSFHGDD